MIDRRVALLRGINVGKAKRIAMADLRALFEALGFGEVRTLLNSGNVAFSVLKKTTLDPGSRIEQAIADELGVATRVTLIAAKELAQAVGKNPLGSVAKDPSRLLLVWLRGSKSSAQLKPLLAERWDPEAIRLGQRVAYLWCAKGIADSRLWAAVNRIVGEAGTARNLTTMTKLLALVEHA